MYSYKYSIHTSGCHLFKSSIQTSENTSEVLGARVLEVNEGGPPIERMDCNPSLLGHVRIGAVSVVSEQGVPEDRRTAFKLIGLSNHL